MASVAVTNTFVAFTTAVAADVNTNFSDLVNYINSRNSGSATWDAVYATSASVVPLVVNNSSGSSNIANFQDNSSNVFTIGDGGIVGITTSSGNPLTIAQSDASFVGTVIVANTTKSAASDFNLINLQTNTTSRFKVTGAGAATIVTASSASGGSALTLTEADTFDALSIAASHATYTGSVIFANTTRDANSAFNLIEMTANTVLQFNIRGDGLMTSTSFTANGTVATAMTNLGPVGSSTTIRKWFTVNDGSGNYYIPAF